MSKTQKAFDYMAKHPKATKHAAAVHEKLTPSVFYRAIKARKEKAKHRCPTCGQPVKP